MLPADVLQARKQEVAREESERATPGIFDIC